MRRSKLTRGFTLVELMVVVAIIGILASIAIPSYQAYIIKANRTDAQAFMLTLSQIQQQYLMDSRAYAGSVAALGKTEPSDVAKNYTISIETGTAPPTFTITATPKGSTQSGDGNLTIDQAGTRIWTKGVW